MKRFCVVIVFVLLSSIQVMAQGIVAYGGAVVSTLSAEAPIAIYTFQGSQDDQVTIQAIAITPNLDLAITVQSGAQILASADSDPFTQGSSDARVDLRLPATNVYLVIVSSANGQTGDLLFKLSGQPSAERTIVTGIPADVPINPNETSYYSFTGAQEQATLLNLNTTSPDLQFLAVVRDSAGQIIGTYSGSSAIVNVTGEGPYEIALSGVSSSMSGVINITEGSVATPTPPTESTPTPVAPPPLATEEVTDIGNACVASTTGAVNVRNGPSTNNNVITQMQAGETYIVDGVSADWYRINIPSLGYGWVFGQIITLSGDCSTIPIIDLTLPTSEVIPTEAEVENEVPQEQPTTVPPTVVQQSTPTFTPSYTPTTAVQQATPTFTPSYTPTDVPAQLAPEDARFNNPLNIALDSTASVLDFVSYPNGDTEDRVRWDITGMNQNSSLSGGKARLVISVSCFGEGTENIQFFTGGQTYTCGSTIVDTEVTSASKTGSVVITAVGGSSTYVQWVLTGTATRVN